MVEQPVDTDAIRLTVNGERMTLPFEASLSDVLVTLDRDPRLVAIEHNGAIVPRARFASTRVSPGDQLEIVQFVQGGSLALP